MDENENADQRSEAGDSNKRKDSQEEHGGVSGTKQLVVKDCGEAPEFNSKNMKGFGKLKKKHKGPVGK